jgi:hypothetical protein
METEAGGELYYTYLPLIGTVMFLVVLAAFRKISKILA